MDLLLLDSTTVAALTFGIGWYIIIKIWAALKGIDKSIVQRNIIVVVLFLIAGGFSSLGRGISDRTVSQTIDAITTASHGTNEIDASGNLINNLQNLQFSSPESFYLSGNLNITVGSFLLAFGVYVLIVNFFLKEKE